MECACCHIKVNAQLGLNCPSCARSTLYTYRFSVAQTLLEMQHLSEKVEGTVVSSSSASSGPSNFETCDHPRSASHNFTHHLESMRAKLEQSQISLEQANYKCEKLRRDLLLLRERVRKKHDESKSIRKMVGLAKTDLSTKVVKTSEFIRKGTTRTTTRHNGLYPNTLSHRTELCREAARVARFRKRRLSNSDGKTVLGFEIFGAFVPNLLDLNKASPQELTLSLNHLCRLIHLICRYLHIRLPARILLPCGTNAHPMILTPSSSYSHARIISEDISVIHKDNSTQRYPFAIASARNPRSLNIDKPLPNLAKEDPKSYALFVEGVALLAWDVAWLCRTQGFPVASKNWQDACFIGKNIWRLTMDQGAKFLNTDESAHNTKPHESQRLPNIRIDGMSETMNLLGRYSQGSAFSTKRFLDHRNCDLPTQCGVSESSWEFASSVRFVDSFKTYLQADLHGQEWELLEEDDYVEGSDDPVVVGARETHIDTNKHGWTKLRPRPT